MDIDTTEESGRILIRDRFDKIERAKPSIHPSLIRAQQQLSKQTLFGNTSKTNETPRAKTPSKKEEGEGGVKMGRTKAQDTLNKKKLLAQKLKKRGAKLTTRNLTTFKNQNKDEPNTLDRL